MMTPCGLGRSWPTPSTRTSARTSGRAVALIPDLLDEMDTLPTSLPHGDAAPVNLLRPRGEPGTYVAIDWAFQCQLPLGHDLGQLLVGEVERGRMRPERLPGLLVVLEDAYVAGLAEEGIDVSAATVRRGLVCSSLGPRTLPGAFPFEELDAPETDEHVALPAAPRRSRPLRAGPGAGAEWSRDASPSGSAPRPTGARLVHARGEGARAVAGCLDRDEEGRADAVLLELAQGCGGRAPG